MTELVQRFTKKYDMYCVTCDLLLDVNMLGYPVLRDVLHTNIRLINDITNMNQFMMRIVELIKDNILRNMRDISKIRWNIKCFDECVSLHWLIKDVARVLEKYIKHIVHIPPINLDKTIVIDITNNEKIIFMVCMVH